MIPGELEYVRAGSVDEAIAALADPEAKVLAGGHSLIPLLKLRLSRPTLLVDIGRLDLRGISPSGDGLRIGALTTHAELETAPELTGAYAAIAQAAASVGDRQVRNAGTIGGSVAHGDPLADAPGPLLALGARVVVHGAGGEREVPAEEFFLGAFTTALEQQELVVAIALAGDGGGRSAYASVVDPASGYPIAGAAALVRGDGSVSLGLTGVASRPFRVDGEDGLAAALDGVDVLDDPRFDAAYRRHLAQVVARRAIARARGEEI
jgi:carbon-monoxide dehydrogenase medium subunit